MDSTNSTADQTPIDQTPVEGEGEPGSYQPVYPPISTPSAPSAPLSEEKKEKTNKKPPFEIMKERRKDISSHNYDIIVDQLKDYEKGKRDVPVGDNVKQCFNVMCVYTADPKVTYCVASNQFLYIKTRRNQYILWKK